METLKAGFTPRTQQADDDEKSRRGISPEDRRKRRMIRHGSTCVQALPNAYSAFPA
jgi:hypothetical protein